MEAATRWRVAMDEGAEGARPGSEAGHLYETVALNVTRMIEAGALPIGARAPSLRGMAGRHGISLSTALQAYRLLEDRGVLEARSKSGFYVIGDGQPTRAKPSPSAPPERAQAVSIRHDLRQMLRRAADPAYVPLGCAIPDAKLLAAGGLDRFLARAARVSGLRHNTYTEPLGIADLRQEIARRGARIGQILAPDDIAVTCGCTEALSLALQATTPRGGTVAIESPAYFGLLQILETQGLRALELPTHPDHGVEPEALARALGTGRVSSCVLSSSFNNPLGCSMPDERKCQIVDLLTRHGVPLIEDDVYGDIHFGPTRPRPFSALAPDADIIACSSFSKTVAPGYRVGWVASRRRMPAIIEAKLGSTLCGPALTQRAIADFLVSGGYDNHLRRIRRALEESIGRMRQAIARSFPPQTRVSAPAGGFVLWLELPGGVDSFALYRAAMAERICFAPGPLFTATGGYGSCLRLSCGQGWDHRIERGVERLGELVADALGRRRERPTDGARAD